MGDSKPPVYTYLVSTSTNAISAHGPNFSITAFTSGGDQRRSVKSSHTSNPWERSGSPTSQQTQPMTVEVGGLEMRLSTKSTHLHTPQQSLIGECLIESRLTKSVHLHLDAPCLHEWRTESSLAITFCKIYHPRHLTQTSTILSSPCSESTMM